MSMHLKFQPKVGSTTSELRQEAAEAAGGKENVDSNIVVRKRSRTRRSESKGIGESDENFFCQKISDESKSVKSCLTPQSDANKIPKTLTCPPVPKKPIRRAVLSCKRKLMPEFEFFEADRRQEVDEFFRSSFERISAATAKRKIDTAADSSSSSSSSSPPPSNYV